MRSLALPGQGFGWEREANSLWGEETGRKVCLVRPANGLSARSLATLATSAKPRSGTRSTPAGRVAHDRSRSVRLGLAQREGNLIVQDLPRPAVHPLRRLGSHRLRAHDLPPAPEQEVGCPLLLGDEELGTH